MKVCIDCSPLLVRSAGVKTYLHHWLKALRNQDTDSVATFLDPGHESLNHTEGIKRHFLRLPALWMLNRAAPLASVFVPNCSVFHASNLFRAFPRKSGLSATLYDVTTHLVPQFHTESERALGLRYAERILRPADGLICISESSRADAERILRIDPRKMTVIYPGVAGEYFSAGPPESEAAARALKLSKPYFLFASTIEPRKNLDGVLSAWLSLPREFRRNHELAVAGMAGWKSEPTMNRLRQLTRDNSGVRYLGYVPESLMPGLAAGARALLYPSFYEGFGLPVAQALAAGCPVIVSNVSSLPEVAGDAALFVDPRSHEGIASEIRRIAESDFLRDRLRALGLERAKRFRWERAARQSLEYFQRLAG